MRNEEIQFQKATLRVCCSLVFLYIKLCINIACTAAHLLYVKWLWIIFVQYQVTYIYKYCTTKTNNTRVCVSPLEHMVWQAWNNIMILLAIRCKSLCYNSIPVCVLIEYSSVLMYCAEDNILCVLYECGSFSFTFS